MNVTYCRHHHILVVRVTYVRYGREKHDTIRYDSVYLTCSKKLTGGQLSLPHGTNKKLKCETKNKMMSVIGPGREHVTTDNSLSRRLHVRYYYDRGDYATVDVKDFYAESRLRRCRTRA